MKLGYYNPQLKFRQIHRSGKVAGTLLLTHMAYGYTVKLHYFDTAGYTVDRVFPTQEKAEAFFDKVYTEHNERGSKA